MDITPLVAEGQQIVQSYAGGVFRVSGQQYESAVILTPEQTTTWSLSTSQLSDLTMEDFAPVIACASEYDVFLLGCGDKMAFLDKELKNQLRAKGIAFDCMDTGAACRTYNVLMAEGRRVLGALLLVSPRSS